MQIEVFEDVELLARRTAEFVAAEARAAVAARGSFLVAFSGGRYPWEMLKILGGEDVPWPKITVFQVDERVAPAGDPDRNLTHLRESLLQHSPLSEEQIVPMPVEATDLHAAADDYVRKLSERAGSPAVLDLIHLGLGPDGHTASLVPGDPVLQVTDRDVATSGPYQNRLRMTLTYPVLNRARRIVWLVTGAEKAPMLRRALAGDTSIPGGRVSRERAVVFSDAGAASELELK